MRHRKIHTSSFGLKSGPRQALFRGLVRSLVEKERIKTTLPKAKNLRPMVEKAVTLGRKGSLSARRTLLAKYPDKKTVAKIINDLALRFKDRPGGYTRIVKLGYRKGDQAQKALIEFVDYQFVPKPTKEEREKYRASKEFQKIRRLRLKKRNKRKKSLRAIQSRSRRINR